MRKKAFFTIFFLSILILSGCSGGDEPQGNQGAEPSPSDQIDGSSDRDEQDDQDSDRDEQDDQDVVPGSEDEEEEEESEGEDPQSSEGSDEDESDRDGLENGRLYSKEDKNVEIQYPENWYYHRSLTEELDNDYYLFVEFADTPDIFESKVTSTVQLIGADADKEIEELEYSATAHEGSDKKFLLRTDDQDLKDVVDEMATTLKFTQEEDN